MSICVAFIAAVVVAGDDDAPTDIDLCANVECAPGYSCEMNDDGTKTSCVKVMLGEGEKCSSDSGATGTCRVGVCKVIKATGDGFCSAAGDDDDGGNGTNLLWLWVLIAVVACALLLAAAAYRARSTSVNEQELAYADFLRQYEGMELRSMGDDDIEATNPATPMMNYLATPQQGRLTPSSDLLPAPQTAPTTPQQGATTPPQYRVLSATHRPRGNTAYTPRPVRRPLQHLVLPSTPGARSIPSLATPSQQSLEPATPAVPLQAPMSVPPTRPLRPTRSGNLPVPLAAHAHISV